MVIYIDVLFIVNLVINYFILLAVSHLLARNDKKIRLLLGAVLGSVYSCMMFFPQLDFLFSAILKLVLSITIVLLAFKVRNIRVFLKLIAYFYVISMLFGGIVFAVQQFFAPPAMVVKNGVAYLDISPILLILTSAGAYVVITLFSKMLHKKTQTQNLIKVKITCNNNDVVLAALYDTGNDLRDAVSGSPVMIAEFRRVEKLLPPEAKEIFKTGNIVNEEVLELTNFKNRFRLVPYSSVGSVGGLLPAFKPDKITIDSQNNEITDILVAVTTKKLSTEGNFSALIGPLVIPAEILTAASSKHKNTDIKKEKILQKRR